MYLPTVLWVVHLLADYLEASLNTLIEYDTFCLYKTTHYYEYDVF